MVDVRLSGPARHRASARTLFLRKDVPSLLPRTILESGGHVTSKAPDRLEVAFRDGTRATFEHGSCVTGGRAVSSKLGYTAHFFSSRPVRRELDDRRRAILHQLGDACGILTAVTPDGTFTGDVAATLATLAARSDAFVFDSVELHTSTGELLLTRKGFVAASIPAAWITAREENAAALRATMRPPPPRTVRDPRERLLLSWEDDLEPLRQLQAERGAIAGVTMQVRVHAQKDEEQLATHMLALRDRTEGWRVSERRERPAKVAFAIAGVRGIARLQPEGDWTPGAEEWLRARASALHAWVVTDDAILDEDHRLLLSKRRDEDPRAGTTSRVLLLPGPAGELALPTLSPSLEVRAMQLPDAKERIALKLAHLAALRLRTGARLRQQELRTWLDSPTALLVEHTAGRPFTRGQLREIRTLARLQRAVIFDGWGAYDGHGRGLLLLNGMWDPAARPPSSKPIRPSVRHFLALGPFPDSNDDSVTADDIDEYGRRLKAIERPVTDQEAAALLAGFGPDDCFGLAFSLVHLIETAPDAPPIVTRPSEADNEWIRRLWNRAVNGGSRPGLRVKEL